MLTSVICSDLRGCRAGAVEPGSNWRNHAREADVSPNGVLGIGPAAVALQARDQRTQEDLVESQLAR